MTIIEAKKKPVIIQCIEWTGRNFEDIKKFCGSDKCSLEKLKLIIPTLEGNHEAIVGDFIIKGVQGEFYPCKHNIFMQTYDIVKTINL